MLHRRPIEGVRWGEPALAFRAAVANLRAIGQVVRVSSLYDSAPRNSLNQPLFLNVTDLIVPHPRFHERRFALEPVAELDPNLFPWRNCSDLRVEVSVADLLPTVANPGGHARRRPRLGRPHLDQPQLR
jgi:7,8-dihydro-6-hydroxymethylpterin-pyrophosphokinase